MRNKIFEAFCLISFFYYAGSGFNFCFFNIQVRDKVPAPGAYVCEFNNRSFLGFHCCTLYCRVNIFFFEFYIYGKAL